MLAAIESVSEAFTSTTITEDSLDWQTIGTATEAVQKNNKYFVQATNLTPDCTPVDIVRALAAQGPVGRVLDIIMTPPDEQKHFYASACIELSSKKEAHDLRKLIQSKKLANFPEQDAICPKICGAR